MTTVAGVYVTDPDGAPEDPTGLWRRLTDELPIWPSHLVPTTPQRAAAGRRHRHLPSPGGRRSGEVSLVTWDVAPDADPARIADLSAAPRLHRCPARRAEGPGLRPPQAGQAPGDQPGHPLDRAADHGRRTPAAGCSPPRRASPRCASSPRACPGWSSPWPRSRCWYAGAASVRCWSSRAAPSAELTALSLVEAMLPVGLGLLVGWWASPPFVVRHRGRRTERRPGRLDAVLVGRRRARHGGGGLGRRRHGPASPRLGPRGDRGQPGPVAQRRPGAGRRRSDQRLPRRHRSSTRSRRRSRSRRWAPSAIVVSAVATTLLAWLVRRWLPRRLGPRLTLSRLARDPASAAAFLAATVAFGAAGYGLLFHASADDATTDKVATAVGANSVFGAERPRRGRGPRRRHRQVDRGAADRPQDQRLHRRPAVRRGRGDVRSRPRPGRRGSPAARLSDLLGELARRAGPRRGPGAARR